jgi:3-methyladenine DNA glycosylase AlkC
MSKQNVVIDKVSFFAAKTVDTLNQHFDSHYYRLSNRCIKILIPYTFSIQEFYDDYESILRRNSCIEEVLEATENHFHSMEFLCKGIIRVRIFTSWWFDLYTTLDDNTIVEELLPVFEKERKYNQRIIDNEMRYLDDVRKKIEYFAGIAFGDHDCDD